MDLYPLPDTFEVALAEYALGLIGSDALPHVGVCALLAGVESQLLAALAGESWRGEPDKSHDLFQRGLAEARVALPEKPRAAAMVLPRIIHHVATRAVPAEVAMPRLDVVFDALHRSSGSGAAEPQSNPDLVALRDCVRWYRDSEDLHSEALATVQALCEQIAQTTGLRSVRR